jgi:hypothetical protein
MAGVSGIHGGFATRDVIGEYLVTLPPLNRPRPSVDAQQVGKVFDVALRTLIAPRARSIMGPFEGKNHMWAATKSIPYNVAQGTGFISLEGCFDVRPRDESDDPKAPTVFVGRQKFVVEPENAVVWLDAGLSRRVVEKEPLLVFAPDVIQRNFTGLEQPWAMAATQAEVNYAGIVLQKMRDSYGLPKL